MGGNFGMGSSNPVAYLDGGQASPFCQNEWFGYNFEQILVYATQVVKMCDLGAIDFGDDFGVDWLWFWDCVENDFGDGFWTMFGSADLLKRLRGWFWVWFWWMVCDCFGNDFGYDFRMILGWFLRWSWGDLGMIFGMIWDMIWRMVLGMIWEWFGEWF